MRSCNCSKLPQSSPVSYFLPRERQFQFTAMFGVNYSVSGLTAHFSVITVNLMVVRLSLDYSSEIDGSLIFNNL